MKSDLLTFDEAELLSPVVEQHQAAVAERDLSVPDWADRHLILPSGAGAVAHDQTVTPYWRHWHAIARSRITGEPLVHDPWAHRCERLFLITGAQLGKTAGFLMTLLAWLLAVHPRDLAVVLPSHDAAKKFVREKLSLLFTRSPRLAALLPHGLAERGRRLGIRGWQLDACTLNFLNGAVALDLRSRDLPLALLDEFGALPTDADGEGSPLALLADRQKSFPTSQFMGGITTPNLVSDLGWTTLNEGTHERLVIACPQCGAHQWLDPNRLEVTDRTASTDAIQAEDLARWRCGSCPAALTSREVHAAVSTACITPGWSDAGGWVPGAWELRPNGAHHWEPAARVQETGRWTDVLVPQRLRRTGWLNSLYARKITLGRFLAEERRAQASDEATRHTHTNNWRGEPWLTHTEAIAAETVSAIAVRDVDGYQHGQSPSPAWRVTTHCDQQGMHAEKSSFPYITRAWNQDGASRLIEAGEVEGFDGLERLAEKTWPVGGVARRADLISVDTANGTMIRPIRQWCAREPLRRISLSGSGSMTPETPWTQIDTTPKNAHKMCGLRVVFYFNAHLFRDELFEHLRGAPGRATWGIPSDAPAFYRESLQSEERVPQVTMMRGRRVERVVWVPRQWSDSRGTVHTRTDNHWWDCEVMALAAVTILGWFRPAAAIRPTRQLIVES